MKEINILSPEERSKLHNVDSAVIAEADIMFSAFNNMLTRLKERLARDWEFVYKNAGEPEKIYKWLFDMEYRETGKDPTGIALFILKQINDGDEMLKNLAPMIKSYLSARYFNDISFNQLIEYSVTGFPSTEKAMEIYPEVKKLLAHSRKAALGYIEEKTPIHSAERLEILNGLIVCAANDKQKNSNDLIFLSKFLEYDRERHISYTRFGAVNDISLWISRFSFSNVVKYLTVLPDNQSKINYLVSIKTDFAQKLLSARELDTSFVPPNGNFIAQCDLEIQKLQNLNESESFRYVDNHTLQSKGKHSNQGTQKSVFILLESVLKLLNCKGNQTEKGNLMSFLSGFSSLEMSRAYSRSDGHSRSQDRWTDKEKIEAMEMAYTTAVTYKLSSVAKDLKGQLDELKIIKE